MKSGGRWHVHEQQVDFNLANTGRAALLGKSRNTGGPAAFLLLREQARHPVTRVLCFLIGPVAVCFLIDLIQIRSDQIGLSLPSPPRL